MLDGPLALALGTGFLLGLSLAAPPGPIMALASERTVHRGFWPGFQVVCGAITADATHGALVAFGVAPALQSVPTLLTALTLFGALFMGYLAWGAWRTARNPPPLGDTPEPPRKGLARFLRAGFHIGYVLALTSPFNIVWWLSAGTGLAAESGPWVFVGFFAALFAYGLVFLGLIRVAAGRVKGVVAGVSYASALLLGLFALRLVYVAFA
ncbi:MAG TPA: LysE family translocator [Candidatus Thermoplasmatota archaeon]|nr:LysE family translocator [Candidatus Thermoplasmatota archaeon]